MGEGLEMSTIKMLLKGPFSCISSILYKSICLLEYLFYDLYWSLKGVKKT